MIEQRRKGRKETGGKEGRKREQGGKGRGKKRRKGRKKFSSPLEESIVSSTDRRKGRLLWFH